MLGTQSAKTLENPTVPPAIEEHSPSCRKENARKSKDFATADARRDELAARGEIVRDTAEGPQLVRER